MLQTIDVDRWMRQMYRDMGYAAGYGRFAHVYLNGLYWGIYEVAERPNNEFSRLSDRNAWNMRC